MGVTRMQGEGQRARKSSFFFWLDSLLLLSVDEPSGSTLCFIRCCIRLQCSIHVLIRACGLEEGAEEERMRRQSNAGSERAADMEREGN